MAKVLRTHVIKFDFDDGKSIDKGLHLLLFKLINSVYFATFDCNRSFAHDQLQLNNS